MSESPLNPEAILGHLPSDYQATDAGQEKGRYQQLLSSEKDVVLRSVDLIGPIALEEKSKGLAGYAERVALRLGLEGDLKFSRQKIGQYERIFTTFRLTPPLGLGMSIEELRPHSQRKLRVLGGNRNWVLENVEHALDLLGNPELTSDTDLRNAIATLQKKDGDVVEEEKASFENITLRMTSVEAEVFLALLEGVQVCLTSGDRPQVLRESEALRKGQAAFYALSEWYGSKTTLLQGGRPVTVDNWRFLPSEEALLEEGGDDERIAAD